MPEISLTEDQYARLEAVKGDVEDAFVDTYGQARITDAVQYLLDTYTPPDEQGDETATAAYERIATAEYPALQHVASDVPDVPGSGIDADEMRGKLLAELGAETFAAKLDEVDADAAETDGEDEVDADGDVSAAEAADAGRSQPDATASSDDSGSTGGVRVETAGSVGGGPGAGSSSEGVGGDDETPSGTAASGPDGDGTAASGSTTSDTASGETPTTPDSGSSDAGGLLSAANRLLSEHDDKWREADGDAPYEVDLPDGSTESARTKDDVRQLLFRHY